MKKLPKSDPLVSCTTAEKGEHVNVGCGELHVETGEMDMSAEDRDIMQTIAAVKGRNMVVEMDMSAEDRDIMQAFGACDAWCDADGVGGGGLSQILSRLGDAWVAFAWR